MVGDAATGGWFVEKRWWVQLWVFWFGDTCGMFSWGYLMDSWIYWSDIQVRELSLSRDLKAICIDNRSFMDLMNECLDDRTVKNTNLYKVGRRGFSLEDTWRISQKRTQLIGMLWKARHWCFHEEMINTVKNVINEEQFDLRDKDLDIPGKLKYRGKKVSNQGKEHNK